MKRVVYALVTVLALVAVLSTAALADCGSCGGEKAHATKVKADAKASKMGECCITAAKAGKGCCGKSAEEVKVAFASYKAHCEATCTAAEKASCAAHEEASKAATADMHECCAASLKEGKGCCGKDADALKASYEQKVAHHEAAAAAKAGMGECCVKALGEGKGCCGKDADALQASYEAKVKKAEKSQKTAAKEKGAL